MSFVEYLKSVVWEFVFAAVACIALEYSLFNAFYIAPDLQFTPIAAVASAVLVAVLFVVAYRSSTLRIGAVCYGIVVVGALAAAASTAPDGNFLVDVEGNCFFFALVIAVVATLGFLLSRKRLGTALFFVMGAFACAWTQFFYERYEFAWLLLFLLASLGLVVYKNFQASAMTARSVDRVSFAAVAGVSLAATALAVAAGCLVWFAVIAPLNPGAFTIELVTEDRALQEEEVKGVGNFYLTPNMELTSKELGAGERTTDDLLLDENGNPVAAELNSGKRADNSASGSHQGLDDTSDDTGFDKTTNVRISLVVLIVLALLLLIALVYFLGRRIMRNRRLAVYRSGSPEQQVQGVFVFLMGRFERLGIGLPEGSTLHEFANSGAGKFSRFDEVTGVSFAHLARTYANSTYGSAPVSQEDADLAARYYRGFWKAARLYLGNTEYLFKSFRL